METVDFQEPGRFEYMVRALGLETVVFQEPGQLAKALVEYTVWKGFPRAGQESGTLALSICFEKRPQSVNL